ncbi:MAG TPA: DUF4397 domain-containing protein, partial [Gemmatimonadaceae bacterium]|nr:DUF4397 domain-containing protein [Gemmatimonadaceae bacterium]
NAVPDTGALDFRFIDIVADAGLNVAFRGATPYTVVDAGEHTVRAFTSGSNPAVAATVLGELTTNFEAGKTYTVVIAGFSRTGQTPGLSITAITEEPPSVAETEVSLRLLHAGAGIGSIDGFFRASSAAPLPGSPQISGVNFLGASTYVSRAPGTLNVAVTASSSTTVLGHGNAPAGTAGTASANPIAGAEVGGSILTAIFVPRSVAGSQAPQTTAFQSPTVVYLTDRRPALTVP